MGLLSKAKKFFGKHGIKVELLEVEQQDPARVAFDIGDSIIKGNYRVVAGQEAVVLRHLHRFVMIVVAEEGLEDDVLLGEEEHAQGTEIIGTELAWPYTLRTGEACEDSFVITGVDIEGKLSEAGLNHPAEALASGKVRFQLEVEADVEGSPFDAVARAEIAVKI